MYTSFIYLFIYFVLFKQGGPVSNRSTVFQGVFKQFFSLQKCVLNGTQNCGAPNTLDGI